MKEVIKVKDEWYIYRSIAEIYYRLGRSVQALDYLCLAVLAKGSVDKKVNLFYLCYQVLNSLRQPEFAMMHAQLYHLLKLESGAHMKYEIERLNIDETKINKRDLIGKINELWMKYKFKDQKLQHGTVIKFFSDKNYGFIKREDGESIFFHRREFEGDNVYIGQLVSFYTEKNFDKSKNRESIKAVCIRGE
jgi:cold shock CspA family protein